MYPHDTYMYIYIYIFFYPSEFYNTNKVLKAGHRLTNTGDELV